MQVSADTVVDTLEEMQQHPGQQMKAFLTSTNSKNLKTEASRGKTMDQKGEFLADKQYPYGRHKKNVGGRFPHLDLLEAMQVILETRNAPLLIIWQMVVIKPQTI